MRKIYYYFYYNLQIPKFLSYYTDLFHYWYLRRQGVETRFRGVKLIGLPIVSKCAGSRIILEDGVTLVSTSRGNVAGVNHPVILATLTPHAVIRLRGCGMTGSSVCAADSITINAHSGLGANSCVYDTDFHPLDATERRNQHSFTEAEAAPVVIGEDVWVGANAIILKGVVLHNRSVVGAGAVVTKDVNEGELVAGNPAKFIKKVS